MNCWSQSARGRRLPATVLIRTRTGDRLCLGTSR